MTGGLVLLLSLLVLWAVTAVVTTRIRRERSTPFELPDRPPELQWRLDRKTRELVNVADPSQRYPVPEGWSSAQVILGTHIVEQPNPIYSPLEQR